MIRRRPGGAFFALLAIMAAMLPASDAGADGGRRHALVVGNSAYKFVPALENPGNDSRAICNGLKTLGFQATCVNDIPTKGQFKDVVARFVQGVRKGDVILFYFAGHGVEMEGENYLVPTQAEFRSRGYFEDEALRVNYVLDELSSTGSSLSVIILDACRDNPFGPRSRSAIGRGLAIPDRAPAGSIIIFPTSPGKVAIDGGSDSRNGLFTKHLLSHLQTPGLEVEAMFKRVIEGVKTESEKLGTAQIPWMNLSFTGEFCFAGCLDRAADAREREKLSHRANELERQLAQQQRESDEARQRMKEMEARLASQQQRVEVNSTEFKRIEADRAELARKVSLLESQNQGLKKAQQTLTVNRDSYAELQRVEEELRVQQGRLKDVESQLRTTRSTASGARDLDDLRREREDLRKRIQELTDDKRKLEVAEKDLANAARLAQESERYNKELAGYRDRLAALEKGVQEKERQLVEEKARRAQTEEKLKDASRAAVKGAAIVAPAF